MSIVESDEGTDYFAEVEFVEFRPSPMPFPSLFVVKKRVQIDMIEYLVEYLVHHRLC